MLTQIAALALLATVSADHRVDPERIEYSIKKMVLTI
jgi:hypothetical protein